MLKMRTRNAMTVVELLVVIAILAVLICLLLPMTRSSREAARRMSCSNNMKHVGIAVHAYHSAHQRLPLQMGGTFDPHSNSGGETPPGNNRYRLSFLVGILPFMEQQALWETIEQGDAYASMGPPPWTRDYSPWQTDLANLRCPSDPGTGSPALGRTNIAACLGEATDRMHIGATRWDPATGSWVTDGEARVEASGRGFFVPRRVMRFEDITDGLSNTIMAGEIATDVGDRDKRTSASMANAWSIIHDTPTGCASQIDPDRPTFWTSSQSDCPADLGKADQKRGFRWADGALLYSGFNTILPPNRESCLAGGESGIGTVVHDGSGPRAPGSPSPYGLWGALGTRAQNEPIEEQLNL